LIVNRAIVERFGKVTPMDEGRMLLALPPVVRRLVIDLILAGSWAACVAICYPLVQIATDHSPVLCFLESLAPGTLLYGAAVGYVLGAISRSEERKSRSR
jgi:hypothetical protein